MVTRCQCYKTFYDCSFFDSTSVGPEVVLGTVYALKSFDYYYEILCIAYTKPLYLLHSTRCWIETRLEILGSFITLVVALFVVYNRNQLSLGAAGLALCYSVSIVDAIEEFLEKVSDLENCSVAVERIREFCNLRQESESSVKDKDLSKESESTVEDHDEKSWPSEGRISFKNFSAKYREGLEPVLNGINLDISGGEKIGVCGRTGKLPIWIMNKSLLKKYF